MIREIHIDYVPQPLQMKLHESPAREILFGGAAGPGKSMALRFEALKWALLIPGLQVYFFRRTMPELRKNHIWPALQQWPREIGKFNLSESRWQIHNGSVIQFCHCQHEKDVFDYQGAEIHLLLIDELTTFTEFIFQYLLSRLRCTLRIPAEYKHKIPGVISCSNPGGVGHQFVKKRYVDFCGKGGGLKLAPDSASSGGMLREYIPGKVTDNPILMKEDPGYIKRLDALPEPYRTAYKLGDWDIFLGQMFAFNEHDHVIDPLPVPESAPLYMTFDWGFGKPYSCGWWWLDADNRKYRFSELYGCMSGQADTGLRQTDHEIAERIVDYEKKLGICGRRIMRYADPTIFNKKANFGGGGQVESTANVFAQHKIYMLKGAAARIPKIRQFHAHLRCPGDTPPMMLVYNTCRDFIRTIPMLQADPNKPEDVDTRLEDHCLAGDTEIITDKGVMKIQDLVGTSGKVLSINSEWKHYSKCRKTRENADTIEVVFEDGLKIRCTPDHRFMDISANWREALSLTDEVCYTCMKGKEYLCKSKSSGRLFRSSTGKDSTNADTISSIKGKGFIGLCGCITTGKSRKGIRSITRTKTGATTIFRICNYFLIQGIFHITQLKMIIRIGRRRCLKELESGMVPRQALFGTGNNMKGIVKKLFSRWLKRYASIATKNMKGKNTRNTAAGNAPTVIGLKKGTPARSANASNAEKTINVLSPPNENSVRRDAPRRLPGIKVITVRKSIKQDVFCMTVDDYHAMALKNGVIVHNCYDEACHVLMARPLSGGGIVGMADLGARKKKQEG